MVILEPKSTIFGLKSVILVAKQHHFGVILLQFGGLYPCEATILTLKWCLFLVTKIPLNSGKAGPLTPIYKREGV